MADILDAQASEFDERNLFLFLSLGLLSVGGRLENLLRRHAPEHAEQRTNRLAPETEPLAYLALGAIRICDVIRREMYVASARTSTLEDDSTPSAWPIDDVLR